MSKRWYCTLCRTDQKNEECADCGTKASSIILCPENDNNYMEVLARKKKMPGRPKKVKKR